MKSRCVALLIGLASPACSYGFVAPSTAVSSPRQLRTTTSTSTTTMSMEQQYPKGSDTSRSIIEKAITVAVATSVIALSTASVPAALAEELPAGERDKIKIVFMDRSSAADLLCGHVALCIVAVTAVLTLQQSHTSFPPYCCCHQVHLSPLIRPPFCFVFERALFLRWAGSASHGKVACFNTCIVLRTSYHINMHVSIRGLPNQHSSIFQGVFCRVPTEIIPGVCTLYNYPTEISVEFCNLSKPRDFCKI